MDLDSRLFIHDADKAAMEALKTMSGFTQAMKAFADVWDERKARIENLSTNIKLGENQMAKYYNMLPPICEKLGIEVPELYLKSDAVPKAYTWDHAKSWDEPKPYIVITSGLLESMPDELIPTILAHECGHIVCGHPFYTAMGNFILSRAADMLALGLEKEEIYHMQVNYACWMKCSEFSADRVAAVCSGAADKVVETTLRLAGYTKNIKADVSVDAFLEQAEEYKRLVNEWAEKELGNRYHGGFGFSEDEEIGKLIKVNWMDKTINGWVEKRLFLGRDIVDYANAESPEEEEIKRMYENLFNKAREFMLDKDNYHSLNAVRACEINEWAKKDLFKDITDYVSTHSEEVRKKIPAFVNIPELIGRNISEVTEELKALGFNNICFIRNTDANKIASCANLTSDFKVRSFPRSIDDEEEEVEPDTIISVLIDNRMASDWYMPDQKVFVEYFEPKTDEEIALEHPDEIKLPFGYKHFLGKNYEAVQAELSELGYSNFNIIPRPMSRMGWGEKENSVAKIIIENKMHFEANTWFNKNVEIIIYYYMRT